VMFSSTWFFTPKLPNGCWSNRTTQAGLSLRAARV